MTKPALPWIKEDYLATGLMSGTSLDGLDIVLCRFHYHPEGWSFHIVGSQTLPYPDDISERLATAQNMDGLGLSTFHNEYGRFLGHQVKAFLDRHRTSCDLIASHGHTIFHMPERGLTLQVGNGLHIAMATGITTIFDFRSQDVALGGQGAPLVPVGDRLLFREYEYCLNLGGFSNISFELDGRRMAFDPCPVNYVINHCMRTLGQPFDKNGQTARRGRIHQGLLWALNGLDYYHTAGPKSLGREWLESEFFPLLDQFKMPVEDQLRTIYEHISVQISGSLNPHKKGRVLVTGGGAYNTFLVDLLTQKLRHEVVVPPPEIIDFKEALLFAFLGVLRIREEPNCLSSSTGARKDHSSGMIVFP